MYWHKYECLRSISSVDKIKNKVHNVRVMERIGLTKDVWPHAYLSAPNLLFLNTASPPLRPSASCSALSLPLLFVTKLLVGAQKTVAWVGCPRLSARAVSHLFAAHSSRAINVTYCGYLTINCGEGVAMLGPRIHVVPAWLFSMAISLYIYS